ncbi:MAG: hypothetical protein GY754_08845 [bacterium]|nr:hypothetical protein [bacterium]
MTAKAKCVHCGELVHEFTVDCPKCGKPVANKDAPTDVGAVPWKASTKSSGKKSPVIPVIISILVIAIAAALVYFLKF